MMEKVRLVVKTGFWPALYQVGFWVLFSFMVGCVVGSLYTGRVRDKQLRDAVFYKAMEVEGQRYNLVLVP